MFSLYAERRKKVCCLEIFWWEGYVFSAFWCIMFYSYKLCEAETKSFLCLHKKKFFCFQLHRATAQMSKFAEFTNLHSGSMAFCCKLCEAKAKDLFMIAGSEILDGKRFMFA